MQINCCNCYLCGGAAAVGNGGVAVTILVGGGYLLLFLFLLICCCCKLFIKVDSIVVCTIIVDGRIAVTVFVAHHGGR